MFKFESQSPVMHIFISLIHRKMNKVATSWSPSVAENNKLLPLLWLPHYLAGNILKLFKSVCVYFFTHFSSKYFDFQM